MSSTDRSAPANAETSKKGGNGKFYVIPAVCAVVAFWVIGVRNDVANLRQDVLAQFGQVQNVMQRRNDVLVNVANVAAAAAKNERGALTDIAKARAEATGALNLAKGMDLSKLSQDKDLQEKFFQAMAQQQQAMLKLTSVVEAYPEIKATGLYARLQDEVSGSENRIAVERMRSQQKIRAYNARIVSFPGSAIAGMFGYPEMSYYEAAPAAQQAPDLGTVLNR